MDKGNVENLINEEDSIDKQLNYSDVAYFEHSCSKCNVNFSAPVLSDFSYGSFVFTCECGKEFVHLEMLTSPECKLISLLFYLIRPGHELKSEDYQDFVAYCVDKSHSHHFLNTNVCPNCQSTDSIKYLGIKTGTGQIRNASFRQFLLLKNKEIVQLFHDYFNF